MPTAIGRDEVRREMGQGRAQLVEVLPVEEYEDEHLPGAINIPLKELGPKSVASLDHARPVVVYCYDHE
jgi:phage shock protein E